MSWYRKVDMRIWGDEKFTALSPLKPSGQALFLYLLTGPHNDGLPGLFRIGKAGLSEALGWSPKDLDSAWTEIESIGMVIADWPRRTIFLPNALKYQSPENPNQIKGWVTVVDLVPEGPLRAQWEKQVWQHLKSRDRLSWIKGTLFEDAGDNGSAKGSVNGLINSSAKCLGNSQSHPQSQSQSQEESGQQADPVLVENPLMSKNDEKLEIWDRYKKSLIVSAKEQEDLEEESTQILITAYEESVDNYYEHRGGSFTPTKKATIAKRLAKCSALVVLFSMEIFIDKSDGTADERYITGIIRKRDKMSDAQLGTAIDRHRESMKDRGIAALMEINR